MIALVSGIIVTGAGSASLWYFMPHGGRIHPLARAPFVDSLIPIGIVSALAIGLALIVASFF